MSDVSLAKRFDSETLPVLSIDPSELETFIKNALKDTSYNEVFKRYSYTQDIVAQFLKHTSKELFVWIGHDFSQVGTEVFRNSPFIRSFLGYTDNLECEPQEVTLEMLLLPFTWYREGTI